jgi:hypothetical protein
MPQRVVRRATLIERLQSSRFILANTRGSGVAIRISTIALRGANIPDNVALRHVGQGRGVVKMGLRPGETTIPVVRVVDPLHRN